MSKELSASNEAILKRLEQAKLFMETNYHLDISLEQIAAAAHSSMAHLTRQFKEIYGITAYQYLMNVRLEEAVRLLKTTDLPVNEIVNRIGFYSSSSFIRMFKEEYGATPNVFRKQ